MVGTGSDRAKNRKPYNYSTWRPNGELAYQCIDGHKTFAQVVLEFQAELAQRAMLHFHGQRGQLKKAAELLGLRVSTLQMFLARAEKDERLL
jgi:hypothetical protein